MLGSRFVLYSFIFTIISALTACTRPDATQRSLRLADGLSVFYPANWVVAPKMYGNAFEIHARAYPSAKLGYTGSPPQDLHSYSRMLITFEHRRNHEEALGRLREIAAERSVSSTFGTIAGWPALKRTFRAPVPRPGGKASASRIETTWTTTAVAVDTLLLRFGSMLTPGAPIELVQQALDIADSLTAKTVGDPRRIAAEVKRLQDLGRVSMPTATPPAVSTRRRGISQDRNQRKLMSDSAPAMPGAPTVVHDGLGELEIAATADGKNIVIGANSGYSYSDNGGQDWTPGGRIPASFRHSGDPSLAVGVSDNFYYAFLAYPNGEPGARGAKGCSTAIDRSIDRGTTFRFFNHAVLCPRTGPTACFPDQAHIAADRHNAAPGGGDQIYSVWRNFEFSDLSAICGVSSGSTSNASIVCSADSGASWSAPTLIADGDFPRVAVASDGSVYTVYRMGDNVTLDKFSPCSAGLVEQPGFPVTVATRAPFVTCPVPGLDRCHSGNDLNSPTVVADDTNAYHIYVAYAAATAAGNEDVVVKDSVDGGEHWSPATTINSATTARRFMPWMCSMAGSAIVSWFDRSAASAARNDLTDYYLGGASARDGALIAHPERNLSVNPDPQCASGWPAPPRTTFDSESCSAQPQFAGRCRLSRRPCDFSDGCPTGESCDTGGGGPKYGDYNGNACISNRIYTAWASATAPPGLATPEGLNIYSSVVAVSDFFVRDWTDSTTSGDDGAEPSIHTDFYSTSDVWNRRGATPGAFIGDRAQNENAGNGTGSLGDNWAFARIRRNSSPATGDARVTAHFLVSRLGTGSNYVDASSADPEVSFIGPDPAILFDAGDLGPTTTIGYRWHLNATASTHLCLAVEISSVGDQYIAPGLLGFAPGRGIGRTDTKVLADNNKAQRNMGLSTTPASGATGAAGIWAVVHNGATVTRDMVIRMGADADIYARLTAPRVNIVGEGSRPFRPGERIVLKGMLPEENRWLGLTFAAPKGRPGEIISVRFTEQVDDQDVNGFSLGVLLADDRRLVRDGLELHRALMTRLTRGFQIEGANRLRRVTEELLHKKYVGKQDYVRYARKYHDLISKVIRRFLKHSDTDAFGIRGSLKEADIQARNGRFHAVAVAYDTLLNKVDALATMIQLSSGDSADISQTVRWQRRLAAQLSGVDKAPCAARLAASSAAFARDYSLRRVQNSDYRGLLDRQLGCLKTLAGQLHIDLGDQQTRLSAAIKKGSPSRLQGAHRRYLLKLDAAMRQ